MPCFFAFLTLKKIAKQVIFFFTLLKMAYIIYMRLVVGAHAPLKNQHNYAQNYEFRSSACYTPTTQKYKVRWDFL